MKEDLMEANADAQESAVPAEAPAKKRWKLKMPKSKKGRRWLKIGVAVVIVAALAAGCMSRMGKGGGATAAGYLVTNVLRQDLTVSVSGTATLKPADSYNVTTLATGEIQDAPFEVGDLVTKDTLLYAMDASDATDSVARANLDVERVRLQYEQTQAAMYPTATLTGTVNEVYVRDGDNVTPGTALCKIVANTDLTADFLFTYVSPDEFYVGQSATVFIGNFDGAVNGKVTSVSSDTAVTSNGKQSCTVRVKLDNPGIVPASYTATAVIGSYTSYGNAPLSMAASATVYAAGSGAVSGFSKLIGSTVKKGDTLCTIDSDIMRNEIRSAKLNLESTQLSAATAADNLDDYNIKSPINGTIIEKNFKAGDKVEGTQSGTLAVVFDLSYLKLEMGVNELDIGKIQEGQKVEITADALSGQVFHGVVDKISINGTTANGFTNYPVTIIIAEYGDLKPGMNVSAKIVGEEVKDALCIPVDAVGRGNLVSVPAPGAMSEDGTTVVDASKVETKTISVGRNDEMYIEVTEGLGEGDIVLIANQASSMW